MPMFHPEDEPIPEDMPNLAALDAELTARIRRLVHTELAPIIKAEVEAALERRIDTALDLQFARLKARLGMPRHEAKMRETLVASLPSWAREDSA